FDLRNNSIYGYEGLCRTLNQSFTNIVELIEIAKEIDILSSLDQIMMEQVISEFEGQGKLFINIENGDTNVVVEHINKLVELADIRGITTNDIVIEICEREKWDIDCITSIHELVRNHQFTLAIDDFGTGFSNGTLLLQLEPKIIKVDRS